MCSTTLYTAVVWLAVLLLVVVALVLVLGIVVIAGLIRYEDRTERGTLK